MKSVLLKNTFNDVVDVYDKARPTYPQELLDDVMKFANRNFFESGLEVGAGTGQATDLFLNRIKKLDIVEVGDKQVEYLNEKYSNKNISVYKAYFEDYSSKEKYDLIYSATAFHWVDDTIGYPKAWNMLKDGGVMAVFWHMSSVTYRDYGIFVGLDKIKRKYLPNESLGFDDEGIEGVRKKRIEQIQSGKCFSSPVMKEYKWIDKYDADRYVLLLESYSSTQTLEDDDKIKYLTEAKDYINANGGCVELPQHVMLYMAKREDKK